MSDRYRIEWAPAAQSDLNGILDYIARRDSADAAVAVYRKIMGKVESLFDHPSRCRIPPELSDLGGSNSVE